jgi:hypothetical protein
MKYWLLLAAALLVIGLVMLKQKERFEPEFLDRRQIARTVATEYSSYDQKTNHIGNAPFSMGPIAGTETPFRVNQYTSYVT